MRFLDKSMFIIGAAVTTAALAAGCATGSGYRASVSTGYRSSYYGDPELVYVQPGVQVLADYDEPIFYADNFYWRYSGGSWYRSPYHTGGWSFAVPPPAILRIDRPYAYRHYRPPGWAPRRQQVAPPPTYYQGRRMGHDHHDPDRWGDGRRDRWRNDGVQPAPTYAPPPQTRPSYVAPMRPQYQAPPQVAPPVRAPLPTRAYDTYRGAPVQQHQRPQGISPVAPVRVPPSPSVVPPPPSLPGRHRP